MNSYINLERQFMPFENEASWELAYISFGSDGFIGGKSWDEILEHKRIIVLAEAGAGKTAELREKAAELSRETGMSGFYITLDDLAQNKLIDTLSTNEEIAIFNEWKSKDEDAAFFIDSLDEAKLNGRTFRKALSNLKKGLGGSESRAIIIVSCRVSDWQSVGDEIEFNSFFGNLASKAKKENEMEFETEDEALFAPLFNKKNDNGNRAESDKTKNSETLIVALAPLSIEQAKKMAKWNGVDDVDAFIEAVNFADAAELANRPQDLLSLSSHWKHTKKVGSKFDILKWSINERLKENNQVQQNNGTISHNSAYNAAKTIAAALTLGQKRFVAWPLDTPVSTDDELSLDPRNVLTELSDKEIREFLSRAIFDPANHGRVRFHHRSVQELLCAMWFLDLISSGCPVDKVWGILSEEKYGKVRIRPSLRPITAWLSQLNNLIGQRVLFLSPELLIEGGDPTILSLEIKRKILNKFASNYSGRDDAGVSLNIHQLAYLYENGLVDDIRRLWSDSFRSAELRELLLRLIWVSKIDSCTDIALEAATQHEFSYQTSLGCRILDQIGTPKYLNSLCSHLVENARNYPRKAIGAAMEAVFPVYMSLAEFKKTIIVLTENTEYSRTEDFQYSLNNVSTSAHLIDAKEYLILLYELIRSKSWLDNDDHNYSKQFKILIIPLFLGCGFQFKKAGVEPVSTEIAQISRVICNVFQADQRYEISDADESLKKDLSVNPGATRQQFWLSVNNPSSKDLTPFYYSLPSVYQEIWEFSSKDFLWALADLTIEKNSEVQEILLNVIFGIWVRGHNCQSQLKKIYEAIGENTQLLRMFELLIDPPIKEETERMKSMRGRAIQIKKDNLDNENESRLWWKEFRDKLKNDPTILEGADSFESISVITRWLRYANGWETKNQMKWRKLIPAYSLEVAELARNSMVGYWRTYDPSSLKPEDNDTYGLEVGKIGIAIEADETNNWPTTIKDDEVSLASYYAIRELNYLPNWAFGLWYQKKDISEKIVKPWIQNEFIRPAIGPIGSCVLQHINQSAEPFRSLVAGWIIEELESSEPPNFEILKTAIQIIVGAEKPYIEQLKKLTSEKFFNSKEDQTKLLWLGFWISVDADPAINELNNWIENTCEIIDKDQIVIGLLKSMFADRFYYFGNLYQDYRRLSPLKKLARLAYKHIRREDDEVHHGMYEYSSRDKSEEARSTVLGLLLNQPGEGAYDVINDLANDELFAHSKERFKVLAEERAIKDSELIPWSAKDILTYAECYEVDPQNVGQLHVLIIDKVSEIRNYIENSQFSDKVILRQDHLKRAQERPVQLKLGEQFEMRRNSKYTVVREAEQADYNEPDLLFQHPKISSPVPLEIKVADSWTYNELVDAISTQLIEKYMKPMETTHGHLLLTYHGKKQSWRSKHTGRISGFPNLLVSLQAEADLLVKKLEYIEEISVAGIDLT